MWMTFFVCFALVCAYADSYNTTAVEVVTREAAPQRREAAVVPLEGLDPVLLVGGKEAQGDEQFSVERGQFRYLFAGAETKAAFEKEPGRYEIQLGGACARMGPTVRGNPDLFLVHEGRIYIFGSEDCVKAFKAKPESYLDAGAASAPAAPASEDAKKRGRALVEKAVEAAGGAARVDGLVSYQEKGTVGSRQGPAGIKTALLMHFPDKARLEQTYQFGTIATVVTPAGGFYVTPRGAGDLFEVQRAAYEEQFMRSPLSILRARRGAEFAAAGAAKVGDATVEQVDATVGRVRVRLGIDPATGRVLTLAYRGRGGDHTYGQIVRTFSDFRPVGGLTLPFKTTGTFDGEADPTQSSTAESIVVNVDLAPALFERPKPAGVQ
jgi:YHS domain-containing protein